MIGTRFITGQAGWLSACLLAAFILGLSPSPAAARELNFRPLPPQRVERLSKEAREQYQLALLAIDRVNYERALEALTQAIEIDANDPYLRFELVQLARYLGDTRSGGESIRFYDLAATHLNQIAENPILNARERRRAEEAQQYISALRLTVRERDERRIQHGREIAKQWVREVQSADELEAEKIERESRRRPELLRDTLGGVGVVEGLETFGETREAESIGTVRTAPGQTRDLTNPGPAQEF